MYDAAGHSQYTSQASGGGAGDSPFTASQAEDLFRQFFGKDMGFNGMFSEGGFSQTAVNELKLSLSFDESVQGCTREVSVRVQGVCDRCHGYGGEPGTKEHKCPYCRGSGEVRRHCDKDYLQDLSFFPISSCMTVPSPFSALWFIPLISSAPISFHPLSIFLPSSFSFNLVPFLFHPSIFHPLFQFCLPVPFLCFSFQSSSPSFSPISPLLSFQSCPPLPPLLLSYHIMFLSPLAGYPFLLTPSSPSSSSSSSLLSSLSVLLGQETINTGLFHMRSTCRHCHGQGKVINTPCRQCRGRGTTTKTQIIKVQIPAGVDDGQALRVPHDNSEVYVHLKVSLGKGVQ